jgi:probable rRNA maturation factor
MIPLRTAEAQADENEITLEREVAFLFIHGLLHLLGYDHETSEEDEEEMFDLQENILYTLIENGIVQ